MIFVASASCDVQNVQTRLLPGILSSEMYTSKVVFNAVKIREDNRLLSRYLYVSGLENMSHGLRQS